MVKNLQKSAMPSHKKVGILQPDAFKQYVDLRYFDPVQNLRPFVAHYFVARAHLPTGVEFMASDVLAQPEVHLMLTNESSYIIGPASKKRELKLRDQDVYAGVRFKVGGFYPFWDGKMTDLTDRVVPAVEACPALKQASIARMLKTHDASMVAKQLEAILLEERPSADDALEKVQAICSFVETHKDMHTVHAVAKAFGLSERTLQGLFASRVGVGVKWVILRARLVEAIEYAHIQEKPSWTAIAAQLGYSTQSHFVNEFKKIIGMSPGQYIKMLYTEDNKKKNDT